MIRGCGEEDFESIWSIINDGAEAYRGVIPADCWTDPYMSREELRRAMQEGVTFSGCEENGALGTWADAVWAIRFYEKHGFAVVGPEQKERLLRRYWKVPERQVETSVVLVDGAWRDSM